MTTTDELCRMARAGYEDGHDPGWMARVAPDKRTIDRMLRAADEAKAALQAHEDECWRRTQHNRISNP